MAVTFVSNSIWNVVLDFVVYYVILLVLGKIFKWDNELILDELVVTFRDFFCISCISLF